MSYHEPVQLVILSARPELETNRRLLAAAEAAGIAANVIDGCCCQAVTDERPLVIGEAGRALEPPQVLIARVGNWRPESLLAVVEIFVRQGVATPNPVAAIRCGRDHWQTIERLSERGVPVPRTVAGGEPETLAEAAVSRLGLPVVVKQRRSRMGIGVMRCDGPDHLQAVLDSLWRLGDEVIVQQWVAGGDTSIRLVVAGTKVVAAGRFSSVPGEWRSNAARGGDVEPYRPTANEISLALDAAAVIGLGQCAVDLVHGPHGPLVLEVNPTPGFVRLENATGDDVARALVEHTASLVGRL